MGISQKELFGKIVLSVFLGISFFVTRAPLLNESLGFEEGIFAEIIVNRPSGPLYSLGGRINGENQYNYISHPAVPYELLRLSGFLCKSFLTHEIYLDDTKVTPRLRLICTSYQFILWQGLLFFVLLKRNRFGNWPIIIIFAAMLSPLAIKTSTHLQIDNTSGMLLCGTASFLFAFAGLRNFSSKKLYLCLFAGSFVAGLGKQEWSFALLAAIFSTLILALIFKFNTSKHHILSTSGWVLLGLLAGNAASYLYDSTNYMRGLHYIIHFSKLHETSAGNWNLTHWLQLTKARLPFIIICIVLSLPGLHNLVTRREMSFLSCLILLYGFFLLLGYIASDWTEKPRYFCPSLIVLTISTIILIPDSMPVWFRSTLCLAVSGILLTTIIFLVKYKPDKSWHLEQINNGLLKSSTNTVLFIQSGAGWNKPEIDYTNNNVPYEAARKRCKGKFDKELINPVKIQ